MNAAFAALGRGVVRFRWVIVIVWILGTFAAARALPTLGSQVNNNNSQFLPPSAPSNQAATLAQPLIGSTNISTVPVVVYTDGGRLTAADQAAISRLEANLRSVPTVQKIQVLGISAQGTAAQLLVTSSTQPFDQTGTKNLIDDIGSAIARAHLPPGLRADPAGTIATNVANQQQSNKQGNEVQLFSILFIIVLLLLIFRSALAPLVTLLPAVFALQLSSAFIGGLGSAGLQISQVTQLLLIVLLLGAGTDYGLFLVFRVREELLGGREPKEAVAVALQRVGESISASAGTVIVALLTLLVASFGVYHDLGVPLAIGIFVMLLAGLTLLPALLAILGRAVFWPSKTAPREQQTGWWGRVAGRLVRRPAVTLALGVVAFGALSLAVLGYKPAGFGGDQAAPAGSSAAAGNAALASHFPQSSANPTNVVMRFSTPVWQDPAVLGQVTDDLRATGRFTTISSGLNSTGTVLTPQQLVALHGQLGDAKALAVPQPASSTVPANLYYAYLASARYVSPDGRTVQWEVGLRAGTPGSTAAIHAVPAIRADVGRIARSAGASANGVAGEAPALADVSNISDGDIGKIIPIAVAAIGVVLALVLRSLVAPLYLILSVVFSYLASLGLAVIAFMYIGGQAGVTFLLPFLMFIFLLALGEDYNILVMTRIREESRRLPLRQAVVRAVGATGPTVTSAGLVLAGTFAVLAITGSSGPSGSQIEAIGFGLAVGILLDTFFVRTVLVPSTVSLLGRWNWWPSAMGRVRRRAGRGPDQPGGPGQGPPGGGGGGPDRPRGDGGPGGSVRVPEPAGAAVGAGPAGA